MSSSEIKFKLKVMLHEDRTIASSLENYFNGDIKYQMTVETYHKKMEIVNDLKLEAEHTTFKLSNSNCLACPSVLSCFVKINPEK